MARPTAALNAVALAVQALVPPMALGSPWCFQVALAVTWHPADQDPARPEPVTMRAPPRSRGFAHMFDVPRAGRAEPRTGDTRNAPPFLTGLGSRFQPGRGWLPGCQGAAGHSRVARSRWSRLHSGACSGCLW